MYIRFFKRAIDLAISVIGMILLSPVFIIAAVAIKLDDHGPVFFIQKRVGIRKSYFKLYKFRTMKVNTPDIPTHLLENPKQYISAAGRFLRSTSLDELPQLLNILLGEMSVVGPRPALWNQDDLVAARDAFGANDVRPGLTGWAQVNGRDELPIEVKAALDGEYVKKMGVFLDCKCVFLTILTVFRRDGVVEGGTGAMETAEEKREVVAE